MATFNTSIYSVENAPAVGSFNDGRLVGGNLRTKQVRYALAGTEAANDILNICKLPPGSVPIPSLSNVFCQDPGTTLTLDVGTSADTDSLADGIVLSSGGLIGFTSATAPALALTPAAYSGEVTVYGTVASAASLTAGAVLVFTIAYQAAI